MPLAIFLLVGSISFCHFVLTVDSLARFWVLSIYHFHARANSQLFATFKAGHLVTSGGLPSIQVGSSAQWAERLSSCAHVHLSSTSTVTSTHACTFVLNLFNLVQPSSNLPLHTAEKGELSLMCKNHILFES